MISPRDAVAQHRRNLDAQIRTLISTSVFRENAWRVDTSHFFQGQTNG